ncbi:hypothetical protein HD554DRAFT_2175618 [Boletus coccyginus]|nr:hypothetical protein HD554DRAFT_2175618 [Boletus coccyginus]
MPSVALYLLSLCKAVENSDFSFGVVSRLGTQSSTFQLDAAKLIHSISEQWAQEILALLRERKPDEIKAELNPTLDLATEYLNHLLIATRNPGGKKTPEESTHPTPDIARLRSIKELLDDATINRNQSALKTLVCRRDGYHCPLTGYSFRSSGDSVDPSCAHILPFSNACQPYTLKTLEAFTGRTITANVVRQKINHPSNAFNAQGDAHASFDRLAWGIEALQQPGGEYKYIFRSVRDRHPATVRLRDGDEIVFCKGEDGQMIDAPDPSFCNLKLAIARVMYASGASGLVDEVYDDDDDDEMILFSVDFTTACLLADFPVKIRITSRNQLVKSQQIHQKDILTSSYALTRRAQVCSPIVHLEKAVQELLDKLAASQRTANEQKDKVRQRTTTITPDDDPVCTHTLKEFYIHSYPQTL